MVIHITVDVTVVAGVGQVIFAIKGDLRHIGFKIPDMDNGKFFWEIRDEDGFPVDGSDEGKQGKRNFRAEKYVDGKNTLYITDASDDGVYRARLWVDVTNRQ